MTTKNGSNAGYLWQPAEDEFQQQKNWRAWEQGVSPRYLKAGILGAMAIAFGTATLLVGNPVKLFAGVAASLADKSPLQPGLGQPMQSIRLSAEVNESTKTKSLPRPTVAYAAVGNEVAAASESAQRRSETDNHDALFRQFQAWVAEREAQAHPQDTSEDATRNALAQEVGNVRTVPPKHKNLRSLKNARAEMRARHPRRKVHQEQEARAQVPPEQNVQAPGQPVQNEQAFPFLQIFGPRN
jgi:hypothetical protein